MVVQFGVALPATLLGRLNLVSPSKTLHIFPAPKLFFGHNSCSLVKIFLHF